MKRNEPILDDRYSRGCYASRVEHGFNSEGRAPRIIDFFFQRRSESNAPRRVHSIYAPPGHRGASVHALNYRRSCAVCKIAQGQEPRQGGRERERERETQERRCAKRHTVERTCYNLVSLPRSLFLPIPPPTHLTPPPFFSPSLILFISIQNWNGG